MVHFLLRTEEQRYGTAFTKLKKIKSKENKQFASQRCDSDLENREDSKSCFNR